MTVTKEEFKRYVEVQRSGITNMMDISNVTDLASLSRGQVLDIMENYSTYKDKFKTS